MSDGTLKFFWVTHQRESYCEVFESPGVCGELYVRTSSSQSHELGVFLQMELESQSNYSSS